MGHEPRDGARGHRARALARGVREPRRPRGDRAGARLHGARARHADRGDRPRPGVHRLVHELAHRRPARRRRGRARAARSLERVSAMVVPGSQQVKAQAEAEGLDRVFRDAGFDWRVAGCSMCLGMNPDILAPGERCASTSNRNFEGRQGRGGRTHLVSPQMAAAAAIEGHFVDIRELGADAWSPINVIAGRSAHLDRADVDTDQIMPKQFLKRVERTGFGEFLFYDWAKEPGWELPANPILVAGENFGCGSSREHAPWGLQDYGFQAIVAPELRGHLLLQLHEDRPAAGGAQRRGLPCAGACGGGGDRPGRTGGPLRRARGRVRDRPRDPPAAARGPRRHRRDARPTSRRSARTRPPANAAGRSRPRCSGRRLDGGL